MKLHRNCLLFYIPLAFTTLSALAVYAHKAYGVSALTSMFDVLCITTIMFMTVQYDMARLSDEILAPYLQKQVKGKTE